MKFKIIATAKTCFKEKFGIPRQPGLVPSSWGYITLVPPFNKEESLRGIETFSHLILTWIPHQAKENTGLTVKPPRLGGNKKLGVFATRSPFRPNLICTSVVKIENIDLIKSRIEISNHDLLDGTPIIDIKPYIPHWDSFAHASNGWISQFEERKIKVTFSPSLSIEEEYKKLITQILELDPRPRYQEGKKEYAFKIAEKDVHFRYDSDEKIHVFDIEELGE